jgi:hypothetical protein
MDDPHDLIKSGSYYFLVATVVIANCIVLLTPLIVCFMLGLFFGGQN